MRGHPWRETAGRKLRGSSTRRYHSLQGHAKADARISAKDQYRRRSVQVHGKHQPLPDSMQKIRSARCRRLSDSRFI